MAEEKEQTEEVKTEAEVPKNNSKKLIIIIAAVVILLAAIGIPLFLMSKKTDLDKNSELDSQAALSHSDENAEGFNDEDELLEGEEPLGAIYPLETFVINLEDGKFIRLQVQLEFVTRTVSSRFYLRIVPIRDKILSLLSSKKQEELNSTRDKDALKVAIKDIVNEILKKEEVSKVYFSQFLIQ